MADLHVGLPEETLREAAHKHVRVLVKVERRSTATGREKWGAVGQFEMDIADVWMIEAFVGREIGAGEFKIDVFDADDVSVRVTPPFTIAVEGKAKRPETTDHAAPPAAVSVRATPAPVQAAPVPQHSGGQPVYPPYPPHYGTPGRSMDATSVAMNELAELKAAQAKMAEQLKAAQEREAQAREEAREAKHRGELAALNAKLEALATREPPPPAKTFDPAAFAASIAPLAAAFAPVLGAMLQTRAASAEAQAKLQFESMQSLMRATLEQANRESPIEKLIPLALPLIQSAMAGKGSDAASQAALYETLMNGQLNTVSMMAQLVAAQAENVAPESPMAEVIKAGLGALGGAMEGWFQSQAAKSAAGALPPPAQEPKPSAPTAIARVNPQVENLWSKIPAQYRSDDLRALIEAVHNAPLPEPADTADALASILEGHVNAGKLPEAALYNIADPEETLIGFTIQAVPHLAQQPEWLRETARLTVEMLREDGYLPTLTEESEEEGTPAIEPPGPSAVEEVKVAEPAPAEPVAIVEKPKRQPKAAKQEASA